MAAVLAYYTETPVAALAYYAKTTVTPLAYSAKARSAYSLPQFQRHYLFILRRHLLPP
jgi:hypothetical protein